MNITLNKVTGQDEKGNEIIEAKTYVVDHLKARMVRKALELTENINLKDMSPKDLDTMIGYLVDVYRNKFTIDDVYDGLNSDELIPTITKCIQDVVGTMGGKLEQMPKN